MDIYDLSSDSWKTPPDAAIQRYEIMYIKPGFSLKGNTYWHDDSGDGFVQCFDFRRERFGLLLPLQFNYSYGFNESLSLVKEDKLTVLLEPWDIFESPVWVSNKIEPDYVSWSIFFKVERLKLNCRPLFGSLLLDEEKKTIVVFDDGNTSYNKNTYIIDGESGHLRQVESIQSSHSRLYNIVSNYVPRSVQI